MRVPCYDAGTGAGLGGISVREEKDMTLYITQGRFTHEAIKGMVTNPEDRADQD